MNTILDEAKQITEERQSNYDVPENNFSRIAEEWNLYFKHKNMSIEITAEDVAIMMIKMKIVREIFKPGKDNLVDLCGYAHCLARIRGVYKEEDQII